MSLYIISGSHLFDKVKIGITFDPISRIKNMQTYHPEPVRYVKIYTLTYSKDITLKNLEKYIFSFLEPYKYTSPAFYDYEKKPTEFYSNQITLALDYFMQTCRFYGLIDYEIFDDVQSYLEKVDDIMNPTLYDVLKGRDKEYKPQKN